MEGQREPGSSLETPQGLVEVVPQLQALLHGWGFLGVGKPPPAP